MPTAPEITAEVRAGILAQQCAFLRTKCHVLLQQIAAAKVAAGATWDSGTSFINAEATDIDRALEQIAQASGA